MAATSTAKVLMAQFPRKRRNFLVPGCTVFATTASRKVLQ